MAAPASSSAAAASALSAFLRGVERRALVVAELQGGDAATAGRDVAAAMRAFAGHAASLAMADWPARFWALLCGALQLRPPAPTATWPPALDHLRTLAPADRLALLLRVGAGLDEDDAAAALGMEAGGYRQALARACPLDACQQPDAAAWRALAEQVQTRLRDLPPQRLQQLQQLRDALGGTSPPAAPPKPRPQAAAPRLPRTRWSWRTWLLLCLPLLALAVVALWWWRGHGAGLAGPASTPADGMLVDNGPVQVEALPDDAAPAVPAATDTAADAAMLADPELALAQQADFLAWYAAGGPLPVDESQPQPSRPEPAGMALETVDAED